MTTQHNAQAHVGHTGRMLLLYGVTQFITSLFLSFMYAWCFIIGLITDALLPMTTLFCMQHVSTLIALLMVVLHYRIDRPHFSLHLRIFYVIIGVNTVLGILVGLAFDAFN